MVTMWHQTSLTDLPAATVRRLSATPPQAPRPSSQSEATAGHWAIHLAGPSQHHRDITGSGIAPSPGLQSTRSLGPGGNVVGCLLHYGIPATPVTVNSFKTSTFLHAGVDLTVARAVAVADAIAATAMTATTHGLAPAPILTLAHAALPSDADLDLQVTWTGVALQGDYA